MVNTNQDRLSMNRFALGLTLAMSLAAGCAVETSPGSPSDDTTVGESALTAVPLAERCTGSELHPYPGLLSTCQGDSSNRTSARNFANSFCANKGGVLSSGFACTFSSRVWVTFFATCNAFCGGT